MGRPITISNVRYIDGQESVYINYPVPEIPGHYLIKSENGGVIITGAHPQVLVSYTKGANGKTFVKDLYSILRKHTNSIDCKLASKISTSFNGLKFANVEEFIKALIKYLDS